MDYKNLDRDATVRNMIYKMYVNSITSTSYENRMQEGVSYKNPRFIQSHRLL